MPLYRQLFLFLFFFVFVVPGNSTASDEDSVVIQKVSAWDEGAVNYRHPPYQQIEEWQKDKRYSYDRNQGPGFFDYFIGPILYWILSATEGRSWVFYVFLILGGVLVLLLLLRILDVPVTGLFIMSRHDEGSLLHFNDDEQVFSSGKLHEMLHMFRTNGAYREAVRVIFLLYLRKLHERGTIVIKHFKTNSDYYREIDSQEERNLFRKRMRLFNIVWYGHADISSIQFNEVEKAFGNVTEGGMA